MIVRRTVLTVLLGLLACSGVAAEASRPISLSLEPQATCRFGPDLFIGGVEGRCYELGWQQYRIEYRAGGNETPIHVFNWPDGQLNPPQATCAQLCDAGALYLSYHQDELGLRPGTTSALASGGGCSISQDSPESWTTGDCERGGAFRCHGACGKGCVGCEVEKVAGLCGWLCEPIKLHCYTRPCCKAHDDCLAAATTDAEEDQCHVQAGLDGCTLADADGTTNDLPDAECMDFEVCVSVPQPEPIDVGEVQPGER